MSVSEEVYRKIQHYLQLAQYKEAERTCLFELGKLAEKDGYLLFLLGTTARMLHKKQAASVAFNAALSTDQDNIDYLQASASAREALGDHEAAYRLMARVIELAPHDVNARANLAVALDRLNRGEEALDVYAAALQLDARQRTANLNYGTLLHRMGRKREALVHNRLAHARLPEVFGTLYNLVDTLIANFEYQEALDYCEKGLIQRPHHAHLMMKKAIVLSGLSRRQESLVAQSSARIMQPGVIRDYLPETRHLPASISIYLDGEILEYEARYTEQASCYWRYRSDYLQKLHHAIQDKPYRNRALSGIENAFRLHSLDIPAVDRLKLMRNTASVVSDFAWRYALGPFQYRRTDHAVIRIGYLSPDFREHATAILSRQIYGMHDRSRFKIYGYSLHNAKQTDRYRTGIENTVDVFRDVSAMHAADIAKLIHADEVDILVDLAGYSAFCRAEVMAMRPAPVQMQ
ncbi:MAG: hypothetical protein CVU32_03885, partial [Betaproteobacteria bacterium HGW-Betaproteobacteria-5]